ncbi:transcriptional regulator PadR family protein (plasmid) [halophilic archaeon DL31]|jgi:DNA-binding PadR family transcriptional regulator|nr:transcriptional regulator PadR family protein [halophilic archaeon DL31]
MTDDFHELTGFQRDLLYVIAGFDHPSGQRVASELEQTREKEISHGRLYPNLDVLVEADLVKKGEISHRTNFYALTSTGEEALWARRAWENDFCDRF